jgi:hypothetical protein
MYELAKGGCRACSRELIPIRETPQGPLCFLCWANLPICPTCQGKILGGSCDHCGIKELHKNYILTSSTGGFMADHAMGYVSKSNEPTTRGEPKKTVRKTNRHIVRASVKPKAKKVDKCPT